ncbi:MAG: Stp1/IreP family PP2C-type Ser/Thr phosphatase [Bacillota bacterium]
MRFAALSDKGKKRSVNEDNFFVNEKLNFFMVADGMGGHAAGEIASQIAAEVSASFNFSLVDPLEDLNNLTQLINEEIIKKSKKNIDYQGMGTTFAAVLIKDKMLYYTNLGDSRIYIYNQKNKILKKISQDHSLVADLLRKGKITKSEAFNHPQKNILTQALGLEEKLDLDQGKLKLDADDYILLCTDGLSDMLKEEKISYIFNYNKDLKIISEKLLEKALSNGGLDNITILVVDWNE